MGRFNLEDTLRSIRALMGDATAMRAADEPTVAVSARRADDVPLDWKYEDGSYWGMRAAEAQEHADAVRRAAHGAFADIDVPPVSAEPDFALDSPLFRDMYKADMAYDNLRKGRTRNLRNAGGELAAIAQDNIRTAAQRSKRAGSRLAPAAAVAGAGAGVGLMLAPKNLGLTESGNPADLRDEPESASDILSRPEVPMVPQEDIRIPKKTFYEMDGRPFDESVRGGRPEAEMMQPVATPADYSMQAREMINKLNAMRRAAGGEVREAPAMMREINRLMELGNRQRNQPGYQIPASDPARDPYQQAKNLIARVNDMYKAGYTPNSPEVQRVMADVRRLHAEGDAIRNRRAG